MDHSNHNLLQAGSQTAISDRMRELLARAAQDHVYEQRTQSAVLEEIRQRVEGMEWLLRELREVAGLATAVEQVTARLDELTAKPPAWAEALSRQLDPLREQMESASNRLRDLTESVAEVNRRLTQVQAGMDAAAGRFTRLDRAVAALTERLDRLEGALGERIEAACQRTGETVTGMVAGTVAGAVAGAVDPVHGDVARRLTGLEETMLALAEALLRPGRAVADRHP